MNYRCGCCGAFTDKDGNQLAEMPSEDNEELLHCNHCTCQYYHEEEARIVTREMAMDAQDMRLEGTRY